MYEIFLIVKVSKQFRSEIRSSIFNYENVVIPGVRVIDTDWTNKHKKYVHTGTFPTPYDLRTTRKEQCWYGPERKIKLDFTPYALRKP